MDESMLIPQARFRRLVREIAADVKEEFDFAFSGVGASSGHWADEYRWEKDALIALQMMTEHVLIMFFGMTYGPYFLC